MLRAASLLASFLLYFSVTAESQAGIHVGIGKVDEIDGQGSEMAAISWETEEKYPWEFLVGTIRGRTPDPTAMPDVYFGSVSKRIYWGNFYGQFGVAMTNSDNEVLSEHWQFQSGIGYRYNRFTLTLRHLSNGNTGGRNRGENYLMLQYGF